ncbi:MAG: DUF1559 domain-containing protein, partial [Planctomycetales bacterium]|nr:DUF1559 domain-containing protein [Planctomycetales bacterium]
MKGTATRAAANPFAGVRRAFTLIELLVVIATLGVLVTISLPAIQSMREASRRTICLNNLRQVGVALRLHHEYEGHFPAGGVEWRPPGNKQKRQLAWSAFILPYLEQRNIYDALDLSQAFDSEANQTAAAMVVETYLCPTGLHPPRQAGERAPCDYGGIFGERILGPNQPPKGILVFDRKYSDADVRDGLSFTMIVGEDTAWPDGEWI